VRPSRRTCLSRLKGLRSGARASDTGSDSPGVGTSRARMTFPVPDSRTATVKDTDTLRCGRSRSAAGAEPLPVSSGSRPSYDPRNHSSGCMSPPSAPLTERLGVKWEGVAEELWRARCRGAILFVAVANDPARRILQYQKFLLIARSRNQNPELGIRRDCAGHEAGKGDYGMAPQVIAMYTICATPGNFPGKREGGSCHVGLPARRNRNFRRMSIIACCHLSWPFSC